MRLLVLAAGMGSRFGGVKQVARIGPSGETILEYSLYDALLAGFDEFVFLVRGQILEDFSSTVLSRLPQGMRYEIAFQETDSLLSPAEISLAKEAGRLKPWGTGHALLCALPLLEGSCFAAINADDYYGREAFAAMARFLADKKSYAKGGEDPKPEVFSMPGYKLSDVVPREGSVSRAVCRVDEDGSLLAIEERVSVEWSGENIVSTSMGGDIERLDGAAAASMNFWALGPGIFPWASRLFGEFIGRNAGSVSAEFWLPSIIEDMVAKKAARVEVARVSNEYFGLTNPADLALTRSRVGALVEAGIYPGALWGSGRV